MIDSRCLFLTDSTRSAHHFTVARLFLYLSLLTLRSRSSLWKSVMSSNWGKYLTMAPRSPSMTADMVSTLLISPVSIFSGFFGPIDLAFLPSLEPAPKALSMRSSEEGT